MSKKILIRIYLIFIPVAYISYLFHEFGHWVIGELLGNNMVYSLNYVWPVTGHYISSSHELYVSIGGPAFTILFSIIFLLIIEKYQTVYVYPFVFFQMFMRFFSLVFGEFHNQDEARISSLLGIGTYTIAIIVLIILLFVVLKASNRLKINMQINSYFFVISTLCQLLVIGTYKIFI